MKGTYWTPFHRLGPLDLVVALYNISLCDHVDCDADMTKKKLLQIIESNTGSVTKEQLEKVLYCLNINDEENKFWHPLNQSFDKYLIDALPRGYAFDKYYNVIEKRKNK